MKIYTKKGDQGQTDLIGKRVSKSDLKMNIVGELDELAVRMAELNLYLSADLKENIFDIDKVLFKIATIVIDYKDAFKFEVTEEEITNLEVQIDLWDQKIAPLKNFITYDGDISAIKASAIKTQVRKVERLMTDDDLPQNVLKYLNRLSDYFFVLGRYLNKLKEVEERKREI